MRRVLAVLFGCSLLLTTVAVWSVLGHVQASSPAPGTIDTLAGGGTLAGDGIPATSASLDAPIGVAVNSAGDVFFSELVACTVYKVSLGIITAYAGTGTCPSGRVTDIGDGGPATSAILQRPFGLALDGSENLYIADTFDCSIRKVDATTRIIATVAGNGACTFTGSTVDGVPATEALIPPSVEGIAVDAAGNIFIPEWDACVVREVSNGIIFTVAGHYGGAYPCAFTGDGGPATDARLNDPQGVAVDADGNLYIADGCRLREVSGGIINTVAGTGNCFFNGDGPAQRTSISPFLLAADSSGNVYFADDMHCRIRRLKDGVVTTLAGRNYPPIFDPFPDCGYSGDGGAALQAQVEETVGVAVDGTGNIYFTELDQQSSGKGHVRVVYHPLDLAATPTYTATNTPTITPTPTITNTPTNTPTPTLTPTPTNTLTPTPTATPIVRPSPGLDFALGIDVNGDGIDDCVTTGSGPLDCQVPAGGVFRIKVYLRSLPLGFPTYLGFDLELDYAGVTSSNIPDTRAWPDCGFPVVASPQPKGSLLWGCGIGVQAPPSTYTGVIATTDFACTADGSVMLRHGAAQTDLIMTLLDPVAYEGGPDVLSLHCVAPTPTPTRVPSCADFDRSGAVTISDLLYVIRRFHSTDLTADLNNDGVVAVADIMIALRQFGKSC
jgi:hypothetical protein